MPRNPRPNSEISFWQAAFCAALPSIITGSHDEKTQRSAAGLAKRYADFALERRKDRWPDEAIYVRIDEAADLQAIILALAELALSRPGWNDMLGGIAAKFSATEMFEGFKKTRKKFKAERHTARTHSPNCRCGGTGVLEGAVTEMRCPGDSPEPT